MSHNGFCDWRGVGGLLQEPAKHEPAAPRFATIEAAGELLEVTLQAIRRDRSLVRPEEPPLEQACDSADSRHARKTVRAGDAITARIHLEHTRPRTATVPFSLWIEDSDGTFIVGTTTPPMTFRYGDTIDREIVLQIPDRVQPGVYTLLVGIGEMQQGVAAARQSFRVIR